MPPGSVGRVFNPPAPCRVRDERYGGGRGRCRRWAAAARGGRLLRAVGGGLKPALRVPTTSKRSLWSRKRMPRSRKRSRRSKKWMPRSKNRSRRSKKWRARSTKWSRGSWKWMPRSTEWSRGVAEMDGEVDETVSEVDEMDGEVEEVDGGGQETVSNVGEADAHGVSAPACCWLPPAFAAPEAPQGDPSPRFCPAAAVRCTGPDNLLLIQIKLIAN